MRGEGHKVLGEQVWQGSVGQICQSSHILRACNLAFAGASNYKRGLLSFKHSSVDGQSASLTDLRNGEQVDK